MSITMENIPGTGIRIDNSIVKRKVLGPNDWNVVNNEDFKEIINIVFNSAAMCLANTLGPYGTTTIMEQFGEMHVSKDGWQVLKKIHIKDMTMRNVLQLLYNISAQVVTNVGDGSTSSIIAANELFNILNSSDILNNCRPKDFIDVLNKIIGSVCEIIAENATKISKDGNFDEIYKLAMVSTNGDDEIAKMIHTIYKETQNPSIEYTKAKGRETKLEIIEGYKSNMSYIDEIFAQNEDGLCKINNPIFLLFDHKIEKDVHYDHIIEPAIREALKQGRRLVVVAPHYDKYLLNYIANKLNMEFKATGTSSVVYTRVSLINNLLHLLYSDFAVMCNGTIMSEAIVREITEIDKTEAQKIIIDTLGECSSIEIGKKTTLISGFHKRNEDMYQKHVNQAVNKYEEELAKQGDLAIVSMTLYEYKQRIAKLKGIMGHIAVGGYTSLERTARYDLVEDAVKACDSAYNNGYNLGGNIAILIAIDKFIKENEENISPIENEILTSIYSAFRSVFSKVLENKTSDINYINDAINKSIESGKTFNILTNECDDNIINSCRTDIEILKATSSIISLLISSNQYLSIQIDR